MLIPILDKEMKTLSSMKTGGKAKYTYFPENIEELTQIIRHIIGIESLNDEGKELSADFNGDSRIDVTDVSMSINYIVYGTMERDKEAPLNPEIKVEGEGNKETGWYRSDIEVEIEENEQNEIEAVE